MKADREQLARDRRRDSEQAFDQINQTNQIDQIDKSMSR